MGVGQTLSASALSFAVPTRCAAAPPEPGVPERALTLSSRIFWTINVATVLESSLPVSIVRRQSGMISVDKRKLITSVSSTLTSAPTTPRLVRRRYSNGLVLETVLRKGYRKRGMCAAERETRAR
jgi:hypothetical protein